MFHKSDAPPTPGRKFLYVVFSSHGGVHDVVPVASGDMRFLAAVSKNIDDYLSTDPDAACRLMGKDVEFGAEPGFRICIGEYFYYRSLVASRELGRDRLDAWYEHAWQRDELYALGDLAVPSTMR